MQMNKMLIAAMLSAAPFATMAATAKSVGNLDIYYTDAEVEVTGGDDDGDGFGVRGAGKISDQAFVFGEYQKNEYDDSNLELQQIRAGLGYLFSTSDTLDLYGKASFLNFDAEAGGSSEDDNGWGVHGGVSFVVTPAIRLFAEIGYLDVGDSDGPEYNFGGNFMFTEQVGLTANYRISDFDVDGGGELKLNDLQVGVRFNF